METLILMVDTAAILVVVIYSLRNERRPADTPETGPFRLRPPVTRPIQTQAVAPVRRRRMRSL